MTRIREEEEAAPTFYFGIPSISPKLMELGSWNLVHQYAFAGTMAPYKNLPARGRLGRSAAPIF